MEFRQDLLPRHGIVANVWLLASLFLSLLVLPLFEEVYGGRAMLLAGLTATFVLGAMAARSKLRVVPWALMFVALPIAWATLFVDSIEVFIAHCLLGSVFFFLVGAVIVLVVVRTHTVTFDSVFGAISAYLLFGLAWALSYWAIHTVSPGSFSFPPADLSGRGTAPSKVADLSEFIYYSFVTMATLGYGDITPSGRFSRALSWIQSVTGQFYVAVVIAWLVSALPRPGDDTRQARRTSKQLS
jgi:voltage-gated potassium channel